MNKNKLPINTIAALATTLFINGCVTTGDTILKTEVAPCCLTCKKPDNGCKAVTACRHASPTVSLEPDKCKKLGGIIVEETPKGVN